MTGSLLPVSFKKHFNTPQFSKLPGVSFPLATSSPLFSAPPITGSVPSGTGQEFLLIAMYLLINGNTTIKPAHDI